MADREGSLVVVASSEGAEKAGTAPQMTVVVHPLVLLSTHKKEKPARRRNPRIWYLDHNYLETMARMYKKVNAREIIVGFYSTGPKIKENDIKIDELMRAYCTNPVEESAKGEDPHKEIQRTFKHVASHIGAYEAEEVGVEHLLRDVNDPTVSTLASQIKHKIASLEALRERLADTKQYLENVLAGRLPVNNQIVYNLQAIFNLLPNLNVDALVQSMLVKTNDMHLAVYCAALVRCIIALHNLVNNNIANKDLDEADEKARRLV